MNKKSITFYNDDEKGTNRAKNKLYKNILYFSWKRVGISTSCQQKIHAQSWKTILSSNMVEEAEFIQVERLMMVNFMRLFLKLGKLWTI